MKETNPSEGIYKYEEKDNRWIRFAKLQQPRNHHAAVYCKGYLYILGRRLLCVACPIGVAVIHCSAILMEGGLKDYPSAEF